jgi:hypothetical protein
MSISSLLFLFIFVHSLDKKEKNKKIALQMYANHYGPPIQYLTYVPQVVNYGQPLGAQPLTTVRTYSEHFHFFTKNNSFGVELFFSFAL